MKSIIIELEKILQESDYLKDVYSKQITIANSIDSIDRMSLTKSPIILIVRDGTSIINNSDDIQILKHNFKIAYFVSDREERKATLALLELDDNIIKTLSENPTLNNTAEKLDVSQLDFNDGFLPELPNFVVGRIMSIGFQEIIIINTN